MTNNSIDGKKRLYTEKVDEIVFLSYTIASGVWKDKFLQRNGGKLRYGIIRTVEK